MFDSEFAEADDTTVVAAVEEGARAEAAAAARRLAAIAELARRRVSDDERAHCAYDGWASAATEVGAAMTIGHRRASGQMHIAVALRDRLPRVAALYLDGALSSRIVSAITWRTQLVEDADGIALIDAAVADRATTWGALSEQKLDQAIDAWIARFDPAAVRRSESSTRSRDFCVGDPDDPAETTAVWGRLLATDAAVLKRRLVEMVHSVCDDDPRTVGERRSDAVGAIVAGTFSLACKCGSETCPAGESPRSTNVVIHVLTDQSALDAASREQAADAAAVKPPAALIVGEGIVPTPLLSELIRCGAKVRPIKMPSDEPEPNYRPSADLAQFVRMRDLFCRAPGCDVPADRCDIDHTVPYPIGPTHASNLKCLCRTNHLMKTFDGWDDIQLPDGTVIWTSPSGRTYTTKPGSLLFFETWNTTTADLPPPPTVALSSADRGLMMPRRRRTRAAGEAARIKAERAQNLVTAPF
ncbi:MAG: hypothetical protein QOF67_3926 [Mycobacterium sp.]|jgi:hypothetical protein|nr:hypothetical protein [Mycobacterium sp.]